MSVIKQLFNQTLVYGFSSVIARVLNFFLVPLYTVLFMPSEYAIVAEMYAYAALLMVVGSFGMETSFFRFSKETTFKHSHHINSTVFSSSFTFLFINACCLIFLGTLFSHKIANFLNYPNHSEYIIYFVFIIGFDLLSIIPFAFLRQTNQAIKFATIKTINIIINIFFNLFFLIICPLLLKHNILTDFITLIYNSNISVGYVFLSNLIASFFTIIILFPVIKINIGKPNYSVFIKMLEYSWPIAIAGLAFIINETADKILIKYLLPKNIAMRELGIYAACYKLTIFMTLFVQAYRFAAEPFFFNQFKKPNSKIIYSLMMQVFVLVSLFVFLFVVLHIDLIKLIIPNQLYHEGITIIPILLIANIFLGIYYNLSVWYKVLNKTYYAAIISGLGALLTVVLNFFLIQEKGYIGAAWTTLICYVFMAILSFVLGQRHLKIKYNLRLMIFYFIIAITIFFISQIFEFKLYNSIQLDNTILFLLYCIFMFLHIKRIFKNTHKTQIL